MKESIYNRLEREAKEMDLKSQEKTVSEMSPEARKYFGGFGDKIISVRELSFGMDSTVFIVKLKGFENRNQLVKLYDRSTSLGKDYLVSILKKYFEISQNIRGFLKKEKNPLKQEIIIGGKKYFPEFSIASNGILVEKNGEIGSWIRDWIPEKNFSESRLDFSNKEPVYSYVRQTCEFLTSKFGYDIRPGAVNYKVFIDEENKIVKIIFTDLADYIPRFLSKEHLRYRS